MSAPASYRQDDLRVDAILQELKRLGGPGVGGLSVLDFGAHNGHIAFRLADEGYVVTAVDESHGLAARGVNGIWARVEAEGIPALGRFDVVLALSVLHHMVDWRLAFTNFRRAARRLVLVEVPHAHEVLQQARWKDALHEIHVTVASWCLPREITRTPATRQPELSRGLWAAPPLLVGTPFHGSGNHQKSQGLYGHLFEPLLGYRPYPGSLNVRLDRVADLGAEQLRLRPDAKRDYRLWRGRLPAFPDVPVHIMDVGKRGHGPDCIELLSPVRLRDFIPEGQPLAIEILWQ